MATGQKLCAWGAAANEPTASNFAQLDTSNSQPVLLFDPSTNWDAVFSDSLPANYSSGGITVRLYWTSATATSNNCVWNVAFERNLAGTDAIVTDSFASAQTVTSASPGTAGLYQHADITFTDGAQIDSIAVNERFRIKVTRNAASGGDTMAGNAVLLHVMMKET